jgi:membrane protein insertase Oxa1/YidC/SpoIIIJ
MMMMNVFIIFISATMPAGVLLYWGISNFIQILQQKMVPAFSPASNRAPKSGTYREETQKQALEQENGKAGKTIIEAGGNTDKVAQQKYTKKKRKRKKKRK